MAKWIATLNGFVGSLTQRDRRFFKPPLIPSAFDVPKAVIAFTDGETCVAVFADDASADEGTRTGPFTVSFSVRKPRTKGNWAGILEVPAASLQSLKSLIDQANEYLEQVDDES